MPREDYQERLDGLRKDVVGMSDLVLERLDKGMEALETKDEDLAWEVIDGDDEVNELYLEIEQECVDLIALQQPVAGDLRLIAASFKIITDLERIADLATNLGEYTLDARRTYFSEVDVQEVGEFASEMVNDAVAAYENEDIEACYGIDDRDERLDRRCEDASERIMRDLIRGIDIETDEEMELLLGETSRLLLTIRDLERVGDHAVNIAARTLYMLENDDELIW
ncbi:phosphate signaling complex protein PhoU [Haladaptatus sp. F3-133]|jgi:phosphate transport system protein|uniref:Phosphate-specific transport system accessory protein PhoU n=1 Tax=Halorutilus salinus TaxID=2487751 RepID=A0A9Q4GH50_9EURY|nr:phosphate signaling complex protein PhoU [Halorutilus salinus]MCX2819457.1 phosphate signaling complex protein PhoU [Halorutilus salinus]